MNHYIRTIHNYIIIHHDSLFIIILLLYIMINYYIITYSYLYNCSKYLISNKLCPRMLLQKTLCSSAVPNLVSLSVGILTPFMKCISVSPFAYSSRIYHMRISICRTQEDLMPLVLRLRQNTICP